MGFTYAGFNSDSIGAMCKVSNAGIAESPKHRRIETGSVSGAYEVPSAEYDLISVTINGTIVGGTVNVNHVDVDDETASEPSFSNLWTKVQSLSALSGNGNWSALTFNGITFNEAKLDGPVTVSFSQDGIPMVEFTATFICQPNKGAHKWTGFS